MMKILPGDLKITQKSQNPQNSQNACSKIPGTCFFQGKKAPAGALEAAKSLVTGTWDPRKGNVLIFEKGHVIFEKGGHLDL